MLGLVGAAGLDTVQFFNELLLVIFGVINAIQTAVGFTEDNMEVGPLDAAGGVDVFGINDAFPFDDGVAGGDGVEVDDAAEAGDIVAADILHGAGGLAAEGFQLLLGGHFIEGLCFWAAAGGHEGER